MTGPTGWASSQDEKKAPDAILFHVGSSQGAELSPATALGDVHETVRMSRPEGPEYTVVNTTSLSTSSIPDRRPRVAGPHAHRQRRTPESA